MPHRLDIKCPSCAELAQFEFAEICGIKLKKDVPFFQESNLFEYRQFQDSCGHYWHGAIYYEGLHGDPLLAIHDLPDGHQASDWAHSKYLYRGHGLDIGSIRCEHCGLRKKHNLRWPDDAYFSVSYKNHVLWAFHRESASELNAFLSSRLRDRSRYRWSLFLLHVPTVFKTHKAREAVSRQLIRLLQEKPRDRRSRNTFQQVSVASLHRRISHA